LWQRPELVRGKRVLELGAGTGICSITAAKLGAVRCVATDGDPEVVALLDKNVQVNDAQAQVLAHSLFWGDAASTSALLLEIPDAFRSTDVVLAGDVLYKSELLPLLFATVARVLVESSEREAGDKPAFLLCHIPRADVTHERVQAQIHESGLAFEELALATDASQDGVELDECPSEDVARAKLYYITQV
jgi:predicted nicotinamide N-methyase